MPPEHTGIIGLYGTLVSTHACWFARSSLDDPLIFPTPKVPTCRASPPHIRTSLENTGIATPRSGLRVMAPCMVL